MSLWWYEPLRTFLFLFPAALTASHVLCAPARVEGASMQPTLNPESTHGDVVLINKWTARHGKVRRGDVIALRAPDRHGSLIIKRVVGLENDVILTRGYSETRVRVPPGHAWIEGDCRQRSHDSNDYGPVPLGLLLGRADWIVWPLSRIGRLERQPACDERFAYRADYYKHDEDN
eukprot:m.40408 g.40408  ORF g.40408 m.40408 type:complete len:175 (+) comp11884_c0_seq2:180-704(+)